MRYQNQGRRKSLPLRGNPLAIWIPMQDKSHNCIHPYVILRSWRLKTCYLPSPPSLIFCCQSKMPSNLNDDAAATFARAFFFQHLLFPFFAKVFPLIDLWYGGSKILWKKASFCSKVIETWINTQSANKILQNHSILLTLTYFLFATIKR